MSITVTGCDSPNCNGEYEQVSAERNSRYCFNRVGREGTIYYDGSHWKICQSGALQNPLGAFLLSIGTYVVVFPSLSLKTVVVCFSM